MTDGNATERARPRASAGACAAERGRSAADGRDVRVAGDDADLVIERLVELEQALVVTVQAAGRVDAVAVGVGRGSVLVERAHDRRRRAAAAGAKQLGLRRGLGHLRGVRMRVHGGRAGGSAARAADTQLLGEYTRGGAGTWRQRRRRIRKCRALHKQHEITLY